MRSDTVRIRAHILIVTLVACTLAYSFHLTSFLHAKLAVLCVGAIVLAIATALHECATWRGFRALTSLWVFVLIALVRLAVSPVRVPSDAISGIAYFVLLLLVAGLSTDILASNGWLDSLAKTAALLSAVVAVLGLLQYAGLVHFLFPEFPEYGQRMYGVFGNQDLTGGFIALGIPLLFRWAADETGSPRMRGALWCAFIIALCGLVLSESRSAWIAGVVGIAVAWSTLESKPPRARWIIAGMAAVVIALVALFPQSTVRRLPQEIGIQARVSMWRAAVDMAIEHPVAGVGFGQYAYWSPLYIGRQGLNAGRPAASRERHADQPHSEPLRILAEMGVLGSLCWAWMAVVWLRRARGSAARIAAGPLAAFGIFSMFNGTFESPPHALVALLFLAAPLARGTTLTQASRLIPMPAVLLALFLAWAIVPPSAMLRTAQDVQIGNREASLLYYTRTVAWPWPSAAAHRDYAIALAEAGHDAEARIEFLRAMDGLDTGDILLGLAIVEHGLGDVDAARRHASECLRRWPGCIEAVQIAETHVTP